MACTPFRQCCPYRPRGTLIQCHNRPLLGCVGPVFPSARVVCTDPRDAHLVFITCLRLSIWRLYPILRASSVLTPRDAHFAAAGVRGACIPFRGHRLHRSRGTLIHFQNLYLLLYTGVNCVVCAAGQVWSTVFIMGGPSFGSIHQHPTLLIPDVRKCPPPSFAHHDHGGQERTRYPQDALADLIRPTARKRRVQPLGVQSTIGRVMPPLNHLFYDVSFFNVTAPRFGL